jgi:pimeloyl-ACP methyl ester carboxylesterase
MLHSVWQASQILWTLHSQASRKGKGITKNKLCSSYDIDVQGLPIQVDHYEPNTQYTGTVVVIHGMSPKGKQDPRVSSLCFALSKVGYRVIAPDIDSIKQLIICPSQIDTIANILYEISNNASLTPSGKIGVLAPSFSGAMCLAAAALPDIKDRVKAVCAIGAFTEVDSVMSYLLNNGSADPYGRFIVLKKIVPLVCPEHGLFQGALDAAIQDNLNEIAFDEFTNAYNRYLSSLIESDRQKIRRLFHDAVYREQLFASSKIVLCEELKALDIVHRIEGLSANIFLLHGLADSVIPCQQSERLYQELKGLNKKAELVITPFLSHGDTQFRLSQLPDLARVVQGFASYFRSISHVGV